MVVCCGLLLDHQNYEHHIRSHLPNRNSSMRCPATISRLEIFETHFIFKHLNEARTFFDVPQLPENWSAQQRLDYMMSHDVRKIGTLRLPVSDLNSLEQQTRSNSALDFSVPALDSFDNSSLNNLNQNLEDLQGDEEFEEDLQEIDLDLLLGGNLNEKSSQTGLTQLEIELLDAIIKVKSNNTGTLKVIRESMISLLNVISPHFKISEHSKQLCTKIINNDYQLKKRRIGNIRSKVVNHEQGNTYYYCIQDILSQYVHTPIVLDQLKKERSKPRDGSVIRSILDLDHIRQQDETLRENEINLYFDIYYDDVNKSKRTSLHTNISLVYLSVSNLNYKFKSKRNSIGLVAASKRSTVVHITHQNFFHPISNQINRLVPIVVNGIKFLPKFFSVKADNKASHEMIVDIPQGFNSDSCRRCKTRYEQLKGIKNHLMRNLPSNHVFAMCTFFSINLYSFCWFHDLCEGVIEKLMDCILKDQPQSFFNELNDNLQLISKTIYKKNRLSSFKVFKSQGNVKLKGTGIQKLTFFILFSKVSDLFVNDQQPNHFHLYALLRKIINFCLADEIYREDLSHLKDLSSKFIDLFINTFANESVVFKMHYLEHYDEVITEFSLPMLSSTLVYERVNQKVIRSTEGSRNYIDIALQMFNNFSFKVEDYFKLSVLEEFRELNRLDSIYIEFINKQLRNNERVELIQDCDLLVYDNMKVKLGNFYLLQYSNPSNNMPVFIQVLKLFYLNNRIPIIAGRLHAATEYYEPQMIYKFKRLRDVISIHPNQILHHKKMICFKTNEENFVIDNFYVKNDRRYSSLNITSKRV